MTDPSIKFITVLPKVPFKCHYILNDGEEHWMDYDELLKFCQNNCPLLSNQLIELFITHESFIMDVVENKIEILLPDDKVYEDQMKKIIQSARNPATAHADFQKQQELKVPFENRIIQRNQSITDDIYKRGRDR